tara:strand:+ start:7767 stop:8039 length:273 start_codon:yes stop_codon:yes gene_type:complete
MTLLLFGQFVNQIPNAHNKMQEYHACNDINDGIVAPHLNWILVKNSGMNQKYAKRIVFAKRAGLKNTSKSYLCAASRKRCETFTPKHFKI